MGQSNESQETEQGMESLRLLFDQHRKAAARHVSGHEGMLESVAKIESREMRREILEPIFDQLHGACEAYKTLARKYISEEDFPERAARWYGFFSEDDSTGAN